MAYPTTPELVGASQVAELTSLSPEQQDALRDAAIIAIESYCGQSFTEFDGAEIVLGSGARRLDLPRRLERLDALSVQDGRLDATSVRLSEKGDYLWVPLNIGVGYYTQTLLELQGWDWRHRKFKYEEDVTITGLWGWADPPANVVTALRYDMEDTALADASGLSSTVHAARKLGLSSISQGNLTASLANAPGLSSRVEQLLHPYVWLGRMGAVV